MWEQLLQKGFLLYLIGAVFVVGVISRGIAGISAGCLLRAAKNMSKSNQKLMRLVKSKFEHACMVSERVENVRVFVEKYLYEYRVMGLHLHTWRHLEIQCMWAVAVLSLFGAALSYLGQGVGNQMYQYLTYGGSGVLVLVFFQLLSDQKYKINVMENYMVDYLENVCLHKFVKAYGKSELTTIPVAAPIQIKEQSVEKEPAIQPKTESTPEITVPLTGPEIPQVDETPVSVPVEMPQVEPNLKMPEAESNLKTPQASAIRNMEKEHQREEGKSLSQEVLIRQILEEFLAG